MRRIAKGILVLILLTCAMLPSVEVDAESVGESSYTIVKSVNDRNSYVILEISNGNASITTLVMSSGNIKRVEQFITLQRYDSGRWITVKTWSRIGNSTSEVFSTTHSLSKRGNYRCQLKASVLADGKTETITKYSGSVSY